MNKTEDKRNIFNLIFENEGYEDWYITLYITLHTAEPKTEEEIMSLIKYYGKVNEKNYTDYSPIDIMDDLCSNNEGWFWYWTDTKTDTE